MRAVKLAPWGMAALLWLPVALAGGLGFAPLSFLMVLFVLFQARETVVRPYMIALAAAFAYAAISSLWSPFDAPLVVFDLENGKFAIKATAIRVGLVAILTALVIGAALKTSAATAKTVASWFIIIFILHGVMLLTIGLFTEQALDLAMPLIDDRGEGVQNIGRNAVIFSLAGILLMAAVRSGRFGVQGAPAHILFAGAAIVFIILEMACDNVAGAVAVLAAYVLIYVVDIFGPKAWRFIGAGTAVYLMTTPLWTAALINVIGDAKSKLPLSAWWRIDSWTYALDEIVSQKPFAGWGLDAMRAFRETFSDGRWEGQLKMPNHPHNMPLHVWAETGLIGATLVSAACLLLGWRLSNAVALSDDGRRAAAGLWAAVLVVCSFSFSLWNEWWWALVGLTAAIAVLFNRAADANGRVKGES